MTLIQATRRLRNCRFAGYSAKILETEREIRVVNDPSSGLADLAAHRGVDRRAGADFRTALFAASEHRRAGGIGRPRTDRISKPRRDRRAPVENGASRAARPDSRRGTRER